MANIDARSCGYQASGIHKFASLSEAPSLHVVAFDASPDGGTDYVFDISHPGRHTIRVWTNAEWDRLPETDRPAVAFRDHLHERWFALLDPEAGPDPTLTPCDVARGAGLRAPSPGA